MDIKTYRAAGQPKIKDWSNVLPFMIVFLNTLYDIIILTGQVWSDLEWPFVNHFLVINIAPKLEDSWLKITHKSDFSTTTGCPKKVGIKDLVCFEYDLDGSWLCYMVLKWTQGTATNPRLIRVRPNTKTLPTMLSDQSSIAPLYTTLSVGTRWMVLTSHDF